MPRGERRARQGREIRGQGTRRTKQDRAKQLQNYPANYAICRITGRHSIDPEDWPEMHPVPSGWVMTWECPLCTLEITVWYDHYGFRDPDRKPTRKYPEGYGMEEGGRLQREEKADMFIALTKGPRRR
jgi:hypothetical protein